VSFALTNTAAGVPARVTPVAPVSRSATVTRGYAQPLQARVVDALGNPVAGATVTFTLGSGAATAPCGAGSAASAGAGAGAGAAEGAGVGATASFVGGGAQATATTGASGLATSPTLTANASAGTFAATATVSSGVGAGAGTSGASDGAANAAAASADSALAASFTLRNLPGAPSRLTAGIGATQSTVTGTRFPIRLAVTVDDAEKNPVPGGAVTFAAPASGPGGTFTVRSRAPRHRRSKISHPHSVRIKTDACGIAVAPALTAGRSGGYIVEASAAHARPAAFALVNEQPGRQP
jgi:hypothetical protein